MKKVLVTGADSLLGEKLIERLATTEKYEVVTMDEYDPPDSIKEHLLEHIKTTILEKAEIYKVLTKHKVDSIFHLGGISANEAEKTPEKAHFENITGSANLLETANEISLKEKKLLKFIYPSSIAVYQIPTREIKLKLGLLKETDFVNPLTIYGITKLHNEMLGNYYSKNYKTLEMRKDNYLDFRSLRLPGIIAAFSLSKNGETTENYDMIHSMAKGSGFESFVSPGTKLPFIALPDAINALLKIENFSGNLSQTVYNVSGIALTMDEFAKLVNGAFPDSAISYTKDEARQKIVDSWPESLDDTAAIKDWGWQAEIKSRQDLEKYLNS